MNFQLIVLNAFILIFCSQTSAFTVSEGQISAAAGLFAYKTKFEDTKSGAYSPLLGGQGLVVNGGINDHSALELAFFHLNKLFIREQAGSYISESTELLQIGMGYRYWFNPTYSASLAFFSSYSIGDPFTVHNEFTSNTEVLTSARDITEYGFDFALQAEAWQKEDLSIITEARYSRSVTNKESEEADHYGLFVALRYVIQEKSAPHHQNRTK